MKTALLALVILVWTSPLSAQEPSALRATLKEPSLWTLIAGSSLAADTTTKFVHGHGESRSHHGPCVEGNTHWDGMSGKKAWGAESVTMASGFIGLYIGHRLEQSQHKLPLAIGRLMTWTAAAFTVADGIHNVYHCRVF